MVVDYCLVPYDYFIIDKYNAPAMGTLPDHSFLSWVFKTKDVYTCNKGSIHEQNIDDIKSLAKLYNLSEIPCT